jgi:pimeloyl-ACP methyl ester carboxylesterase
MPTTTVNGVRLSYTLTGDSGPPLVLVHGSWADQRDWELLVSILAERFRVLTYDRRGHSQSECPPGQGSVEEDAADLAALIEHLKLAPAHIVGLSLGGSIVLRLAARRPGLIRSLSVQEPPLLDLLADDPGLEPEMRKVLGQVEAVAARLDAGDAEGGARQFIEAILGPGAWDYVPPEQQQILISNAPTFLDETRDPEAFTVDLAALATCPRPALLTYGDQSPSWFLPIVAKLATVLPRAETRVFAGAGHLPMVTHPAEYAAAVMTHADAADAELGTNVPPPDRLERLVGADSATPA